MNISSPLWLLLDFSFLVQLYSNQGVSWRNIGQEQWELVVLNYVIQCRFSEFQLCIKYVFFGVRAEILLLCAKKHAFFGLCAEILLTRNQGFLESRAGPVLGSVKKYWFFGEIFTSALIPPPISKLIAQPPGHQPYKWVGWDGGGQSQRQKNPGGMVALPPGKILRIFMKSLNKNVQISR